MSVKLRSRRPTALLLAAICGVSAIAGVPGASAATRPRVTAVPATTTPTANWEVPIRGRVTGTAARKVVLLKKVSGGWQPLGTRRIRNGGYVFWRKATGTGTYRMLAPATKRTKAVASGPFTLRAIRNKDWARTILLTNKRCIVDGPGGYTYTIKFDARLDSGERLRTTLYTMDDAYAMNVLTYDGTGYNVALDPWTGSFYYECGPYE